VCAKDPDVDVHLQAVFAVRQLSLTPKCRFQFIELKGLHPLLQLADSDSVEVQREVRGAPFLPFPFPLLRG
jgi:hypothetical protein